MHKLDPVIKIDEERCINCHACITYCPVKYCVNGAGHKLMINPNTCIGCGHCISICPHNARLPIDDTDALLRDLKRGEKIIAVVAPAVVSVFPKDYLRLNGWLKSLGIEAFFDVSFGAELTVVSYLNYIKEKKPRVVIAQPCPAIVTYIEIYRQDLIPYLAPADSPMLHTIKMINEYYPQYRAYKVAVISPCIAKKREFTETKLGDYNITMLALKTLIKEQKINISGFPAIDYTGPSAERAVSFSAPGGLLDTAERFMPGLRRNTRKIEGVQTVYYYLSDLARDLSKPDLELPLLIDCLNCEHGCNGGPGTGNSDKSLDQLESPIRKRSRELEKQINPRQKEMEFKKFHKLLDKYWKKGLYNRTYMDLSGNNTLKRPNEKELKETYLSLKKYSEADIFDCTACGYRSCRRMATAIFNKLNKPDNCAHYNLKLLEEEKKTTVYINQQLKTHINRALDVIEKINSLVEKLNVSITTQSESVDEASVVTGRMVDSLKGTANLSREKRESLTELIDNAAKGQDAMRETVLAVKSISESVDGIASAIKIISVIASNTNLLSMNAAIEAAHAGNAGKGFAVVADEIRRLSETTRENSHNISQTLSSIIAGINTTSKRTSDTGAFIDDMSREINGFASTMTGLIDTLSELSGESFAIINGFKKMHEHTEAVKTDYTEMLSLSDRLRYDINFLAAMSADIVRAIEEGDQEILTRLVAMETKVNQ